MNILSWTEIIEQSAMIINFIYLLYNMRNVMKWQIERNSICKCSDVQKYINSHNTIKIYYINLYVSNIVYHIHSEYVALCGRNNIEYNFDQKYNLNHK